MKLSTPNTRHQTDAEKLHEALVEICQQIGRIAGCNGHYTSSLTRRVAETGKPLEQLTIAELLALDKAHHAFFNQLDNGDCDE